MLYALLFPALLKDCGFERPAEDELRRRCSMLGCSGYFKTRQTTTLFEPSLNARQFLAQSGEQFLRLVFRNFIVKLRSGAKGFGHLADKWLCQFKRLAARLTKN